MNILYTYHSLVYLLLFSVFIFFDVCLGQIGLKIKDPTISNDTLSLKLAEPVLPLRNWQIFNDHYIKVEKTSEGLNVYDYISPDYFPRNPFKLDLRGTSNYVPREVRDELNLIMNRPRDNAFLPILPVAFIALQMASQHLLINKSTEITAEDIQNCQIALPILEQLWEVSPQTISQLYKNPDISERYTMKRLEELVYLLIDNKLVKSRKIENAETKYFYAIDAWHYKNIIEKAKEEKEAKPYQETSIVLPDPEGE